MHGQLARWPQGPLGVIGNISRDHVTYPGGQTAELLGGAALYLALAAARSGLAVAPAAVIGTDLAWIADDPRLSPIDLSLVKTAEGSSCTFRMAYNTAGEVLSTAASFGAAEMLTSHAVSLLRAREAWHVCCRRPLDARLVLDRLAAAGALFSTDFHLASAGEILPQVRETLPRAAAVFVNAAEFAMLTRVADINDIRLAVVSDGPRPATVLRYGQVTASTMPPPVTVTEATGAGDTLAGTFLAAMSFGLGDEDALQSAVTAAARAVTQPGLAIPVRGG